MISTLRPDRPTVLDNVNCPYCGADVTTQRTEEHVIARKFVPRGMARGRWNLILWACQRCNREKSDLEDDISAITMQPDAYGRYADDEAEVLAPEALRKGRGSVSRSTKKRVSDSPVRLEVEKEIAPGVTFRGHFSGPPQVDHDRAERLAYMHMQAFYYFVTYRPDARSGWKWRGYFMPVMTAQRSDWGNPLIRAFADAVVGWEPRVLAITAGEFFKVAIRRHPAAECWSFALEWNKGVRTVGFVGDDSAARAAAAAFPRISGDVVGLGGDDFLFVRADTPLADADDRMFCAEGF